MITLKVTNTQDTSIIDESNGLSLGEAIQIASKDPDNSYLIEIPGGSTYNVTITEDFGLAGSITLRGVGNGIAVVNGIRSGEQVFQYQMGSGSSVSFNNIPVNNNKNSVFPPTLNINPFGGMDKIRDFDGNYLGSSESWKYLGAVDIQGDGDIEYVLSNSAIGRWATVGINSQGSIDFSNYGEGGDTRIVGIYQDPLIAIGQVKAGSPFDSQQRFQNDLFRDNLELLAADDYDKDDLQEAYFRLRDGTAVLHAYMHADGNIQYANYQSALDLELFMTNNGVEEAVWGDWL